MRQFQYRNQHILAISDTHGQHRKLKIPASDIIVHCGDACTDGNESQLMDFFEWFSKLPIKYKIFVAGNHDLIFDLEPQEALLKIPRNIIYLENTGRTIKGIYFHALPARPWLHEAPDKPRKKIDFLLTHGPAYSILDKGSGCRFLSDFLQICQPAYHIFGHVHRLAGQEKVVEKTLCVNVCLETLN